MLVEQNRVIVKYIAVAIIAVGVGFGVCAVFINDNLSETRTLQPIEQVVEANYAFDIDNWEQSLDFADEVVVVKVDRLINSFEGNTGFPYTNFEATVHMSLDRTLVKGTRVTLRQEGGLIGDELFIIEGEALLKPNRAYVLAVKIGRDGTLMVQSGISKQDVHHLDSSMQKLVFEKWQSIGKPGKGK